MKTTSFSDAFQRLTGDAPFPWQQALFNRFERGDIPSSCNIPTGLGKTNVIAVWLIAYLKGLPNIPRRLVYVVNRRTVVDQTTTEVEKIRQNLAETDRVLEISTLRGQFADNRKWSADPSRPAVICGTVDMIGSRLLFSGYGVGFKGKPLHAGFLGQDVLLVHDEAHLEPAFQDLLCDIEKEQERCKEFQRFRVMELSATSRGSREPFQLTAADKKHATVLKRIKAKKAIHFHKVRDEKKLAEQITELALSHNESERAVLVFVQKVEDVEKVVAKLRKVNRGKENVQQLTGTLRGLERDELATSDPVFARFLPKSKSEPGEAGVAPLAGTVYLVCTSAGEVGVNISGDFLVCDLSTFESMAQRFGRVNRFGEFDGARIDIVHPDDFDEEIEYEVRRSRTLALLQKLNDDGCPNALNELDADDRLKAFAPKPKTLPTTSILFDSWALTTIHDKLPGRPPVEPYLHGISEWEPPEAYVAWRQEVGDITGDLLTLYKPEELLEDYPLKPHELLRDRANRVFERLNNLVAAEKSPDTPVWLLSDDGSVDVTTLGILIDGDKESLDGMTILLPPSAGGLERGLLTSKSETATDVADEWKDDAGQLRLRKWNDDQKPPGMKLVQAIVFGQPDEEDAPPTNVWYWFERSSIEADTKSTKEYNLQPHLDDAKEFAKQMTSRLDLAADIQLAVIVAAALHDLGKNRKRWQNGIGNGDYPNQVWAKSGKFRAAIDRSRYRHEFGSLFDAKRHEYFKRLDPKPELQDLVLHLIAAHHGRGRPHFPNAEAFDDIQNDERAMLLASEVPDRYARLQRKYGRWGLAYLESLVRAVDIQASKKAEGRES